MIVRSIKGITRPLISPLARFIETDNKSEFIKGPYEMGEPLVGSTYLYCTCKKSKRSPFCDHSHLGTNHDPIEYTIARHCYNISLCMCREAKKLPICDGTCAKQWENIKISDNKPI